MIVNTDNATVTEIVNAVKDRKIICAFHDIDGTHSLIRNWPPVMSRVLYDTAVNGIPENLTSEENINRLVALCGAALSLGANVDISDFPGYAPLLNDINLIGVAKEAANLSLPKKEFVVNEQIDSGSTDMGDLCCVMPVVHPYSSGAIGTSHGSDYYIEDHQTACVGGTKFQLAMIHILMSENAIRAKKIVADAKPPFANKEEYFSLVDSLSSNGDRLEYLDDFSIKINIK